VAATCQFILGFRTLHDLAPLNVGECLDNQAFAPNGDAQQHTNKGLLAWRKLDNDTVFTNGYMTWINGPDGLVSRLNTDRFPWEADSASRAPSRLLAPSPWTAIAPSSATEGWGDVLFQIDDHQVGKILDVIYSAMCCYLFTD